ncbi:hypothetical protein HUJ05_008550 [Dendroctonus ponderosae]|nr:hypothetical protein HUJ05_008550 [Dendroctonus ponderosae]
MEQQLQIFNFLKQQRRVTYNSRKIGTKRILVNVAQFFLRQFLPDYHFTQLLLLLLQNPLELFDIGLFVFQFTGQGFRLFEFLLYSLGPHLDWWPSLRVVDWKASFDEFQLPLELFGCSYDMLCQRLVTSERHRIILASVLKASTALNRTLTLSESRYLQCENIATHATSKRVLFECMPFKNSSPVNLISNGKLFLNLPEKNIGLMNQPADKQQS